ncbi:MAG: hypothetical protein WBH47_13445, partial [Streptosporangiaceae bacterium]
RRIRASGAPPRAARSRLDNPRLDGAQLDSSRPDSAQLDGAQLDSAQFDNAQFDNAQFGSGPLGTVRVLLSGRPAPLPPAALRYPEGRLLAPLVRLGDRGHEAAADPAITR